MPRRRRAIPVCTNDLIPTHYLSASLVGSVALPRFFRGGVGVGLGILRGAGWGGVPSVASCVMHRWRQQSFRRHVDVGGISRGPASPVFQRLRQAKIAYDENSSIGSGEGYR